MDWIVSLTPAAGNPVAVVAHPPAAATLVEVRLDLFPGLDLRAVAASSPLPLIATLRSTAEGGAGPTDPAERAQLLGRAREAGASLVDLELRRDLPLLRRLGLPPEGVVVSWHDPDGTPADLDAICAELLATPARLVKAVPTAHSVDDLNRILRAARRHNHRRIAQRRLVAFAMGPVGLPSRFLSPLLGPPLGFAAFSDEAAAAPGQVALATMARVLGHLGGPPQRLFAVVGDDVSGSLSPRLHAAAFAHLGLPYLLVPISVPTVEELGAVIAPTPSLLAGVELELAGWAVTTPYKADAVRLADQVSPRARRAGAANTVLCAGGRLLADTTDGDGVVAAAAGLGVDLAGLTAVVRGTGGAGRGAAVGLAAAGARVVLQGRRLDHTRSVADALGVDAAAPDTEAPAGAVLVNATPLGRAADDPSPFTGDEVARARAVVDMVYARRVTSLAELAASRGVAVADGRDVLAGQGYPQLAAFTGRIPPREIMRRALDDAP